MISATLNQPVTLDILAADGNITLFGQIRIYNFLNSLIASLSTVQVGSEGLYRASWTPNIEGYYTYVGQLYTDSLFVTPAEYDKAGDLIDVNSIKTNILRTLGLLHENTVIDQQVYDGASNLTSARVRCYDSKTNAQAAGVTGLQFIYSMSATYTGNLLTNYSLVRDS